MLDSAWRRASIPGAVVTPLLRHQRDTVGQIVVWALLTGGITGGIWTSIVLLGNQARLRKEQQALGDDVAARRAELARLEARLAFVESRFALMDGPIQSDVALPDAPRSDASAPRQR